jgi:hypothetical protein
MQKKVFISCSSKDARIASSICHALETRGQTCWISSRDVTPGENYQGAIVRAITDAGAMVMVFSTNADNSEEIKKELALASQSNLIVIPVRAEDVLPSEDFRYELATRQWIDLFDDWEQAIETLGRKIDGVIPRAVEPWMCAKEMMQTPHKATPSPFEAKPGVPQPKPDKNPLPLIVMGTMGVLALAVVAGGAWLMRAPPHPDVPAGMMMREADMHDNDHPPPGMDPAKLEADLWDAVKDTRNDAALNSYLTRYPAGIFAAAAKARIEALNKPGAPGVKTASAAPPVKSAAVKPVAMPAAAATPPAMAMPMPAAPASDSGLNSNVQMAVAMARSAETRAREMARNAEQSLKLAQAETAGYGTQTVHNGVRWSGHLADLASGTPGVVTYENGARYAGGTRGGHRDGVGVFTGTPSMAFHERVGEFVTDQMSGYGVVYRNDGRVRVGQWKGGNAEGYGAVYNAQGKLVEQGLFAGDKLVTPLTHN